MQHFCRACWEPSDLVGKYPEHCPQCGKRARWIKQPPEPPTWLLTDLDKQILKGLRVKVED